MKFIVQVEHDREEESKPLVEMMTDSAASTTSHSRRVSGAIDAPNIARAVKIADRLASEAGIRVLAIRAIRAEDQARLQIAEDLPELLSITEAASVLGTTRQAVHQRIESGTVPAVRVGKAWVIPASFIRQM